MGRRERRDHAQPSSRLAWGIALELGLRMGIAVVLGLVPGILVDNWLGTQPLFTLAGVVLGRGGAFFTIWDVARRGMGG